MPNSSPSESGPKIDLDRNKAEQRERKDNNKSKSETIDTPKIESTASKSAEMAEKYRILFEQAKIKSPEKFKETNALSPDVIMGEIPQVSWDKAKIKFPNIFTGKGVGDAILGALTDDHRAQNPSKERSDTINKSFETSTTEYNKVMQDAMDDITKTTIIKAPGIKF